MKSLLTLVTLVLLNGTVFAASRGTLDGQRYAGTVKFQGTSRPDSDTFIFTNGTFQSTACDEYGYTSAPYTVTKAANGKQTVFESKTKNQKGATIAWTGTVADGKINGTAVMTAPNGDKSNIVFEGQATRR